jgi:hypothetical protein
VERKHVYDWTHVAVCLLCVAAGWVVSDRVAATEFSGGTVTGPILRAEYAGSLLFLLSAGITFVHRRRLAAVIGLLAVCLSLPLYAFFIVPGLFHTLFGGEWSAPLQTYFQWDSWSVAGSIASVMAAFVFFRNATGRQFFGANL